MSSLIGMVLAHGQRFFKRLDDFGLERAEFVIIAPEEKQNLEKFLETCNIPFSAHAPIIAPVDYPETPLLASLIDFEEDRRRLAVSMMAETMEYAASLGAEYTVVHLQRPEHFGGKNPPGADINGAVSAASRSCERILELSEKFDMPVLIENLMDNSLFNKPEEYLKLLDAFPGLGFCLDVGHLDVDARLFGFSFDEFVDALLPYIRAVHLQNSNNSKSDFNGRHWKIPVHPAQLEIDGWLDIEKILRKIIQYNRKCVINFEARMDELYDAEYMAAGITWVKNLIPEIIAGIENW